MERGLLPQVSVQSLVLGTGRLQETPPNPSLQLHGKHQQEKHSATWWHISHARSLFWLLPPCCFARRCMHSGHCANGSRPGVPPALQGWCKADRLAIAVQGHGRYQLVRGKGLSRSHQHLEGRCRHAQTESACGKQGELLASANGIRPCMPYGGFWYVLEGC